MPQQVQQVPQQQQQLQPQPGQVQQMPPPGATRCVTFTNYLNEIVCMLYIILYRWVT